jgi:shikimate kinase
VTAKTDRVFIIGMMGVGKSTAGRLLAEALGWPYVDTDEEVPRRAGKNFQEIWEQDGESEFRRLEAEVVVDVASRPGPSVVALGGGAVLDGSSRGVIKRSGLVVWLRADPGTLFGRLGRHAGAARPLLRQGPEDALRRLSDARAPIYESTADLVFDVDRMNPRDVADAIAKALKDRPCAS